MITPANVPHVVLLSVEELRQTGPAHREDRGEDGGGAHQALGQRVHPVKVDEKHYFDDPIDRPHGEITDERDPM